MIIHDSQSWNDPRSKGFLCPSMKACHFFTEAGIRPDFPHVARLPDSMTIFLGLSFSESTRMFWQNDVRMLGCSPNSKGFSDNSRCIIFNWSALQISLWTIKRSSKDPTINDFFFELFLRDAVEEYPTRVAVFFPPGVPGAVVKKKTFWFSCPKWTFSWPTVKQWFFAGPKIYQEISCFKSGMLGNPMIFFVENARNFSPNFLWPVVDLGKPGPILFLGVIYTASHTYISYTHPGCTWVGPCSHQTKGPELQEQGWNNPQMPIYFRPFSYKCIYNE